MNSAGIVGQTSQRKSSLGSRPAPLGFFALLVFPLFWFRGSGPLLAFGLFPFCGGVASRSRPWEFSPAFVLERTPRKKKKNAAGRGLEEAPGGGGALHAPALGPGALLGPDRRMANPGGWEREVASSGGRGCPLWVLQETEQGDNTNNIDTSIYGPILGSVPWAGAGGGGLK